MNTYPFDELVEQGADFSVGDVSEFVSKGISVRVGNRLLKFALSSETTITDEDAIKKEYEERLNMEISKFHAALESYKSQMKFAVDKERRKLVKETEKLQRRMNEVSSLPALTEYHLRNGLSVAKSNQYNLVWNFKTIYAPKFVNERRINPTFAKKMITPIIIEVHTDIENKVRILKVNQIMEGRKFNHYHSFSEDDRDCWGNLQYSGKIVNTPDEMMTFCREAAFLLEVINEMSMATRNPRGLPRWTTLEKNLLAADDEVEGPKTAVSQRNKLLGVTETSLNNEVAENVWSV